MSIVRHKAPAVDSVRNRSDLRAVAGLMPRPLLSRSGGSADASSEQLRVARLDSAVIGACRITPEVMRVGESRLKLGVIRNLAVHPQFDPLTVRSALLEDARRFLSQHRFHVALATGTEFELRRHGFTAMYRQRSGRLAAESEAPIEWSTWRVRPAKHGDMAAMSRLYSASFESIPGSVLRSRAHMARTWSEYEAACVVTDREGKVLAYFVPRMSDGNLYVVEFAYAHPLTPVELKEILREFADVAECAVVVVSGPGPLLKRLDGNVRFNFAADLPVGFVACVDIDELFQSMVPEWERLLSSDAIDDDRELTLMLDGRAYRIRSHHGAVIVDNDLGSNKVALSTSDLANALFGKTRPGDLLGREMRLLNASAAAFFGALFPSREPGISPIDIL